MKPWSVESSCLVVSWGLWPLSDGIEGALKGSWEVLVDTRSLLELGLVYLVLCKVSEIAASWVSGVCIYIVHTRVHIHTQMHECACIYIYMCVCMYAHINVYV